jgi:hypothetical protein
MSTVKVTSRSSSVVAVRVRDSHRQLLCLSINVHFLFISVVEVHTGEGNGAPTGRAAAAVS